MNIRTAAIIVLFLSACESAPDAGAELESTPEPIAMATALVAQGPTSLVPACGSDDMSSVQDTAPELLIFVGADHCHYCAELGYQLRRLERTLSRSRTTVVVGVSDQQKVCSYLDEERVGLRTRLAPYLETAAVSTFPIAVVLEGDTITEAATVLPSAAPGWVDLATLLRGSTSQQGESP